MRGVGLTIRVGRSRGGRGLLLLGLVAGHGILVVSVRLRILLLLLLLNRLVLRSGRRLPFKGLRKGLMLMVLRPLRPLWVTMHLL